MFKIEFFFFLTIEFILFFLSYVRWIYAHMEEAPHGALLLRIILIVNQGRGVPRGVLSGLALKRAFHYV